MSDRVRLQRLDTWSVKSHITYSNNTIFTRSRIQCVWLSVWCFSVCINIQKVCSSTALSFGRICTLLVTLCHLTTIKHHASSLGSAPRCSYTHVVVAVPSLDWKYTRIQLKWIKSWFCRSTNGKVDLVQIQQKSSFVFRQEWLSWISTRVHEKSQHAAVIFSVERTEQRPGLKNGSNMFLELTTRLASKVIKSL